MKGKKMKHKLKHFNAKAVYRECGQCGHWHAEDLPGHIDCRDDAHRFTSDELDAHHGVDNWDRAEPGEWW